MILRIITYTKSGTLLRKEEKYKMMKKEREKD